MAGMQACQEGAPRRRAHGTAGIVLRQADALARQPVNARRMDLLLSIGTDLLNA